MTAPEQVDPGAVLVERLTLLIFGLTAALAGLFSAADGPPPVTAAWALVGLAGAASAAMAAWRPVRPFSRLARLLRLPPMP